MVVDKLYQGGKPGCMAPGMKLPVLLCAFTKLVGITKIDRINSL